MILAGYMKTKDRKLPSSGQTFLKTYKNSQFFLVTPKNLEEFLK